MNMNMNMLDRNNWFNYHKFYDKICDEYNFQNFVEIGVWKGHSISYLAKKLKNRESVKIYAVDIFEELYSKTKYSNQDETIKNDVEHITDIYNYNLNIEGVREMITDIKSISWEAASKFDDESLDFVFIDAGHDYESVTKDISCWFPKIKKGGIISGHDYFNSIEFGGNFGVKKAVDEFFGEKNLQFFEYCWYIKKN